MHILVDKFDKSHNLILHTGNCPDCGRLTILVDERCSLCWENRLGVRIVDGDSVNGITS